MASANFDDHDDIDGEMGLRAEKRKGNYRVLCLDGGGMRGLVTITLLKQLEETVGAPIRECFDWIGGTSVGGILALAIAQGKDLDECKKLMERMKDEVFSGDKPYASEKIEKCLKDALGPSTKMETLKKLRVVVTATDAGSRPPKLVLFRNYDTEKVITKNKPENRFIWEVARATSAAPSYFCPFENFLDGGLMANNPTIDTMREVNHYYKDQMQKKAAEEAQPEEMQKADGEASGERPDNPIGVVVSVGTGHMPSKEGDAPNLPCIGYWNLLWHRDQFESFIEMVLTSLTMSDGETADRGADGCEALGIPYYRFSPTLQKEVELDCCDDNRLTKMMDRTEAIMKGFYLDKFKELKKLLVN